MRNSDAVWYLDPLRCQGCLAPTFLLLLLLITFESGDLHVLGGQRAIHQPLDCALHLVGLSAVGLARVSKGETARGGSICTFDTKSSISESLTPVRFSKFRSASGLKVAMLSMLLLLLLLLLPSRII